MSFIKQGLSKLGGQAKAQLTDDGFYQIGKRVKAELTEEGTQLSGRQFKQKLKQAFKEPMGETTQFIHKLEGHSDKKVKGYIQKKLLGLQHRVNRLLGRYKPSGEVTIQNTVANATTASKHSPRVPEMWKNHPNVAQGN